jgi:two-component system sensor histidine kinase DesK
MARNNLEGSIFESIFIEAFKSLWLPIFFAANIFLTGFLLPTEKLEAGYTLHHWDFVIAISGASLLVAARSLIKNPNRVNIAISFCIAGLGAALLPYIWAELVLPHGIPESMKDKWLYSLNGPVAQIVGFALVIGSIRYGRNISNSVAHSRSVLNKLRQDLKVQIEEERSSLINLIIETIKPALNSVERRMIDGAEREEISESINQVITDVVRPLSHSLDSNATRVNYEINPRLIKRNFRRERIRQGFKSRVPYHIAINAPLALFGYINFNLTTLIYIHGLNSAVTVFLPFTLSTSLIFLAFKKFAGERSASISKALLTNLFISLLQTFSYLIIVKFLGTEEIKVDGQAFALTTFFFTLAPALLGIVLLNLKTNLDKESEITSEIATNLSVIRRQLWALHKKFAREIHGGLQSQLQIFALKFEQNVSIHQEMADNFKSEILKTIEMSEMSRPAKNLKDSLIELEEFWGGIATVTSSIDEGLLDAVTSDELTVQCLYEVIREAINNAVKHSGATSISISLKLSKANEVKVLVENNVLKALKAEKRESLGTTIYKELADSWDLSISQDLVRLELAFTLKG